MSCTLQLDLSSSEPFATAKMRIEQLETLLSKEQALQRRFHETEPHAEQLLSTVRANFLAIQERKAQIRRLQEMDRLELLR